LQVAIKTRNLIDIAGNLLGRDLTANRSLFEGLMMHLKPALYRIKQNMGISNPLLDKIKSDYGELFSIVKEAVKQVFHEFNVPDEEIGYLVMHFGAVILGNKELANLNTLVICPSGIGTSKMLATRLQKEFPELTPIRNVSVREFKKMNTRDYDLVISTIPIPDFHLDYILVSPILNNNEVDKVRSFIGEIRKARSLEKKQELVVKETLNKKSAMKLAKEMDLVSEMAQTISLILCGFETKEVQGKVTTREILTQACQELFAKQRINGIEEVVYSIMEREKLGGLGIPTTAMALYHARSAHVLLPSFTIYMMQNPIKVQGMDNTLMEMKCLILLLAPGTASEGAMEILSFLSSLLIESEESMAFFQSNDQGKITVFLTAKLDQFFDEKLVEIRSV
jgi:mannitol operon transcriptional antiterminator